MVRIWVLEIIKLYRYLDCPQNMVICLSCHRGQKVTLCFKVGLIVVTDFEIIKRCWVFSESFYFSIKRMEKWHCLAYWKYPGIVQGGARSFRFIGNLVKCNYGSIYWKIHVGYIFICNIYPLGDLCELSR